MMGSVTQEFCDRGRLQKHCYHDASYSCLQGGRPDKEVSRQGLHGQELYLYPVPTQLSDF